MRCRSPLDSLSLDQLKPLLDFSSFADLEHWLQTHQEG